MKENEKNLNDSDPQDLDVNFEEVASGEGESLQAVEEDNKYPTFKNIPYRKILDAKGDIVNPITKEDPYRTMFLNGKQRRNAVKSATKNPKNNKKGVRVVITRLGGKEFTKTYVSLQHIKATKVRIYNENLEPQGFKYHKKRTIVHNKLNLR